MQHQKSSSLDRNGNTPILLKIGGWLRIAAHYLDLRITVGEAPEGEANLSHCPLCGSAPKILYTYRWEIICVCGLTLSSDTQEKVPLVERWNARSPTKHVEAEAM